MNCDAAGLTFDVAATAGLYSTAAGLLAGFAFTALIYLIPGRSSKPGVRDLQAGETKKHVLLALVFAFMDLIIVAFLYSFLAGERGCGVIQGRGASEELLGGVAFTFSVLTLLYAIVLMVDALALDDLAEHVRFLVTVLGPPWAMFLVFLAARHLAFAPWEPGKSSGDLYTPQSGHFVRSIIVGSYWAPVGIGLICLGFWAKGRRVARRSRSSGDDPDRGGPTGPTFRMLRSFIWYPYFGLAVVLAAAVRAFALPVTDATAKISHGELWLWLAMTSALLIAQSVILSFARHVDT